LDVSGVVVSGDQYTLTLSWPIAFKSPLAGTSYNQYLKGRDYAKANSGWVEVGTWYVGYPPVAESLAQDPALARPWATQVFTGTFSDPEGGETIARAEMLINHGPYGAYGVHVRYDVLEDRVYLRDDLGTTWLGGYAAGTGNTIENGQVVVKVAGCGASEVDGKLQVRWALEFKPWFIGWRRNVYLQATDMGGGSSGWVKHGVWKVR
jgi:hypothetical protein